MHVSLADKITCGGVMKNTFVSTGTPVFVLNSSACTLEGGAPAEGPGAAGRGAFGHPNREGHRRPWKSVMANYYKPVCRVHGCVKLITFRHPTAESEPCNSWWNADCANIRQKYI